jgi:hypothetical protein
MKEIKYDREIFRCACGHYGFLEFDKFDENDYWVTFIEEPRGLFQRLKSFFQSKRCVSEISLTQEDIDRLVKFLKQK